MSNAESEPPQADEAMLPSRLQNRELSWLDFNLRVLALAEDHACPLLERVKFLAIVSRNLDEFFQVRVALVRAEWKAGVHASTPGSMTPGEQLAAIRERVLEMAEREQRVFDKELRPALAEAGVELANWNELDTAEQAHLSSYFDQQVFPVLTPLAVDPAHPFPYLSNLSLNLAVLVRDPDKGIVRFARIKVPGLLPRFVVLPGDRRFVPMEQLIAARLDQLFPGMEIESHSVFRVTRDADLDIEEGETEDLLAAIESELERQRRRSQATRVEVEVGMSPAALSLLTEELELDDSEVYRRGHLLGFGDLWQLYGLDRPDLKDPPWTPRREPHFAALAEADSGGTVFDMLQRQDVLVHHPYDAFESSVETFLAQAATDPAVLTIKNAIYRTAGEKENSIGRTLIRAARAGKQVVSLVELKARFDEQANIEWARKLEEAGVHVVYGLVGLKTHAKIALVVRQEGDGIRRYCHIGTGNYNSVTARIYEDLGLFTADPDLGADLSELFNHLTGFSHEMTYRKVLVAPVQLRSAIERLIQDEMESGDGRIIIKANSISDPKMIECLYAASQAGVEIDLVIRGICCLRPGVPGLSERIRVRSIVGRYLEHSRIYRFGRPERTMRYFIGSADLMPRNLDRRVELLTPVEDAEIQGRLQQVLDLTLADDCLAWELRDATWTKVPTVTGLHCQEHLQTLAQGRGRSD